MRLLKSILVGVGFFCIIYCTGMLVNSSKYKVDGVRYDSLDEMLDGVNEKLVADNPVFVQNDLNAYISYGFTVKGIADRSFAQELYDRLLGISYESSDLILLVYKDGIERYLENYNIGKNLPLDAEIKANNIEYYIEEERVGTKVDIDKLIESVGVVEGIIDISDYVFNPVVTSDMLVETCDSLNNFVNWRINYLNGSSIKSSIDYVTYDEYDGMLLDDSFIKIQLENLKDSYNSVGTQREFTSSSGEKINISGGTWGSEVDGDEELNFLCEQFKTGESILDRTPIFKYNYEEIGDTYIEVSKEDQYCWLYKDGELVMDTPVVTGNKSNHDTPSGIYFISERMKGKYLTGDGYKTWVNRWMRITNRGHGLHDAGWRSSFGGQIYKYNGSHGCINLPRSFAYNLYDETYVGMPVIIY